MKTQLFPATRSVLSASALLSYAVENYEIGRPVSCQFLNPGLNDTYEVLTDTGRFILRVYRMAWREYDHIQYELDVLSHLDRNGVPVSAPIAAKDGSFIQEIQAPEGTRFAALFTYASGIPPERDKEESAERYGEAAGIIHSASSNFRSKYRRPELDLEHLIDTPLTSVLRLIKHRRDDQIYLLGLTDKMREGLQALPIERLQHGFCHGDFHGGNAHMDKNGVITFFDFDCCGPGWIAYDIAVYRWITRRVNKEDTLWPAFLRGYSRNCIVTPQDLAATSWFVAIRQLWWLGLNADMGESHGYGWMDDGHWDRGLKFLRGCETSYFPGS